MGAERSEVSGLTDITLSFASYTLAINTNIVVPMTGIIMLPESQKAAQCAGIYQ